MNERVTYCRRWSQHDNRVKSELTEAEAHRLFERRKLFGVVIGHPVKPWCFFDVNLDTDFIGVGFLDDRLRVARDRAFSLRFDKSRAFLSSAIFREFVGGESSPRAAWVYTYRADGSFVIHYNGGSPDRLMAGEGKTDLSGHWAPAPIFGEWEPYYRADLVIARPTLEDCTRVWNIPEAIEKLKADEAAQRQVPPEPERA